jgi:hypothetical protein
MSEKASATANSLQRFALEKPILTSLVLLAIVFFLKWIDTWVLRLDERLGEIILYKALGFVLVILFVRAAGRSLRIVVAWLSMFLVKYLAERLEMPEVKPWGQWAING